MNFQQQLELLGACKDARAWVGNKTVGVAWSECERGDWMLWLACHLELDLKLCMSVTLDYIDTVAGHLLSDTKEPRIAMTAIRNWCEGRGTLLDVNDAFYEANDTLCRSFFASLAVHAVQSLCYAILFASRDDTNRLITRSVSLVSDTPFSTVTGDRIDKEHSFWRYAELIRQRIPLELITDKLADD